MITVMQHDPSILSFSLLNPILQDWVRSASLEACILAKCFQSSPGPTATDHYGKIATHPRLHL